MSYLSTLSRQGTIATLEIYDTCLQARLPQAKGIKQEAPPRKWTRGRITTFSRSSKNRMMKKTAKLDSEAWAHGGHMVTLTYPAIYPTQSTIYHNDLQKFRKRLYRRWGGHLRVMWKLEFQRRGAPHFHLLIVGVPVSQTRLFRAWVAQAWYECVQSDDIRHRTVGTRTDEIKNHAHAIAYVLKYVNKDDNINEIEGTGRMWGVWGDMTTAPQMVLELTTREFIELKRTVSKLMRARGLKTYAKRIKGAGGFFALWLGVGYNADTLYKIVTMIKGLNHDRQSNPQ